MDNLVKFEAELINERKELNRKLSYIKNVKIVVDFYSNRNKYYYKFPYVNEDIELFKEIDKYNSLLEQIYCLKRSELDFYKEVVSDVIYTDYGDKINDKEGLNSFLKDMNKLKNALNYITRNSDLEGIIYRFTSDLK